MHAMASQDSAAAAGAEIDVAECERRIGHRFASPGLLLAAVTHASGARHRLASNERLEFLGDSILGFIVCERLFRTFPESLEGDLTKIKSVVVSRGHMQPPEPPTRPGGVCDRRQGTGVESGRA